VTTIRPLTTSTPLVESRLPLRLWRRGKVRDVYELGEDLLLVVATDRLSAFDVVLPTGIPGKGVVLTRLSLFWFRLLADVVPHHVVTAEVDEYPAELRAHREQLEGRSMIVWKTEPLPVECVVRGYLAGSGWKDYRSTGEVCGLPLPPGLREADRLPAPVFTPATKAASGHDENIAFANMVERVGEATAAKARAASLALYARASAYAEARGIILADTKFEFGLRDGQLLWIDEALTPDSSRFWPRTDWAPGTSPPSFDKQYVRDYLETLAWDKRPPGPALPAEVVARTRAKYDEAFARLSASEPPLEPSPGSTAGGDGGHSTAPREGASSGASK
jgi:phosphoribosylaminoimidazole-succinocarboxamide synthase